jgi:hypothetical protein
MIALPSNAIRHGAEPPGAIPPHVSARRAGRAGLLTIRGGNDQQFVEEIKSPFTYGELVAQQQ